ncbi:class I SAM-dependent methyltransferase [Streptomyces sp. NPDC059575]|uniref:class I SAM-dependent methyltransferase n=1 Tax=Streptomyces sp. NPDC059575 TaxID=3346872 RepID=UPI0036B31192
MTGAAAVTDQSAAHTAAVTDRDRLARSAYSSDRDLAARQSLYRWQTPRYDLPGIVAEKLRGVRGRVVDVGCGNGKFIRRLREERPDLTLLGLDIAPGIVSGVPGPVAVADATALPLATNSADAALAMHMLYHVADIAQAVRELARVVVDGGPVIASTNSDRDKSELDDLWQRAAADVLGTKNGPARISLSARFSLERAPVFLGQAFGRIETIELPGTITVHGPEPVVAHMASYQAWADQHDVPFQDTIDRARAILVDHLARHGAFRITCLGGVLVCRL